MSKQTTDLKYVTWLSKHSFPEYDDLEDLYAGERATGQYAASQNDANKEKEEDEEERSIRNSRDAGQQE